jgi:cephalosporin hydroxylase
MGKSGVDPLAFLFEGNWQMSAGDRAFLLAVVQAIRPAVAVEVGTLDGGSLDALAPLCGQVVTVDHDPESARCAERWPNVRAVTGDSGQVLPGLLEELRDGLGFVLVDAAHDRAGVAAEMRAIAAFQPSQPLVVLLHDTSLPEVRAGMGDADWSGQSVRVVQAALVAGAPAGGGGFGMVRLEPGLPDGQPFIDL